MPGGNSKSGTYGPGMYGHGPGVYHGTFMPGQHNPSGGGSTSTNTNPSPPPLFYQVQWQHQRSSSPRPSPRRVIHFSRTLARSAVCNFTDWGYLYLYDIRATGTGTSTCTCTGMYPRYPTSQRGLIYLIVLVPVHTSTSTVQLEEVALAHN